MTSGHPIALLEVMVRRVLPVSAKKKKKDFYLKLSNQKGKKNFVLTLYMFFHGCHVPSIMSWQSCFS